MFNLLFHLRIIFNIDLYSWQWSQEVGNAIPFQSVLWLRQQRRSKRSSLMALTFSHPECFQVLTLIFMGRLCNYYICTSEGQTVRTETLYHQEEVFGNNWLEQGASYQVSTWQEPHRFPWDVILLQSFVRPATWFHATEYQINCMLLHIPGLAFHLNTSSWRADCLNNC